MERQRAGAGAVIVADVHRPPVIGHEHEEIDALVMPQATRTPSPTGSSS
ncbi:hypothetical protein [Streptosporangium saharense]